MAVAPMRTSALPPLQPPISWNQVSPSFQIWASQWTGDSGIGRFSLAANQVSPYNVLVPLEWLQQHRTLPPALEASYLRAAEAIADRADQLLREVDTHSIHADLHLGNVLLRDGSFNLLDFDDMTSGPAVQDLWLALPGRDDETLRHRIKTGHELAKKMSWENVVSDYFLPGLFRAADDQ